MMKKLALKLFLICFLAIGSGAVTYAQDHDAVTDSLSIDDMAPVLYDEDAYEEEEASSNGVIIGILIAVAALGAIGFVVLKQKKK
ncbi:hypothetical protein [Saccharicrinis fermentans]|nr:hypothetical protein [Saccharicrinis fermentans]